jgi:hypothetical protein
MCRIGIDGLYSDLPVDVYAEKYKPTFENMVWLMCF